MLKNTDGYGVAGIFAIVTIVGLISLEGWLFYNNQKGDSDRSNVQSAQQNQANQASQKKVSDKAPETYYQLALPTGWVLSEEKPMSVSYDDAYIYRDSNGKELTVYVNIGSIGGAGDASLDYSITGEKIYLDISNVELCSSDELCDAGDHRLQVIASSESDIKGNNYLFDYRDAKTEDLSSLSSMKLLVESMQF